MGDVEFGRFGGYAVYPTSVPPLLVHVIPEDDLRDHIVASTCWCTPALGDGVVIHNSMDGREMFERGERRVS